MIELLGTCETLTSFLRSSRQLGNHFTERAFVVVWYSIMLTSIVNFWLIATQENNLTLLM